MSLCNLTLLLPILMVHGSGFLAQCLVVQGMEKGKVDADEGLTIRRNGLNGIQLQRGSNAAVPGARSQHRPYLASPESLLDEAPLQTWSWKLEQWGPAVCFNKASGNCDASHHWSRYKEEHSGGEVFANAQGLSIALLC